MLFSSTRTQSARLYPLSLHDALPILVLRPPSGELVCYGSLHGFSFLPDLVRRPGLKRFRERSEEHTSELQSRRDLVCRLLLEKKKCRGRRFFLDAAGIVELEVYNEVV